MLGRDKVLEILHKAVDCSGADQTEVTMVIGESSLTRFANSIIHQNVHERNGSLGVRAVIGSKIGYATTNRLDDDSIVRVVKQAYDFAAQSQMNPDFVSLALPETAPEAESYYENTANYTPEQRANDVKAMIDEAGKADASAAGTLANEYEEFGVVNSLGVEQYTPSSMAGLTAVMTADTGHGYADRYSRRVDELNPVAAAMEAAMRAVRGKDPEGIEPGEYEVILLPYAVAEFMEFLAYMGFGALTVQEGRSFMSDKFGERITGSNITIWDDGLDPTGLARAVDAEGVPKQRVNLVVDGIANAVVYDSYTANKEGKRSTGHATGGAGTYGPMPTNLFMKPGDASVDEMILSTKRGILVTRFHYTNIIHPIQTLITGMTRDGTFLIEDGQIARPLKNLRFTDSILERLSNVEAISNETKRETWAVVPAIKAQGFRFTGATEF